jgi:hypothetical protein
MNIQKFLQVNQQAKLRNTILTATCLAIGGLSSLPLFSDRVAYKEVVYCIERSCDQTTKTGISYIVQQEFRNRVFYKNVVIRETLEPTINNIGVYGLVGSFAIGLGYFFSKRLTKNQKAEIHKIFAQTKLDVLRDNLELQRSYETEEIMKAEAINYEKSKWSRAGNEMIEAMKSPEEIQAEYINAFKDAQISNGGYELNLLELRRLQLEEEVKIKNLKSKLNKEQTKKGNNTTLKERVEKMIAALKAHENGWLWKVTENLTPFWLIGKQGTSKTWTSASFGLLRKYCLDIPVYAVVDEHGAGVDNKPIWNLLEPELIVSDNEEMKKFFLEMPKRWDRRMKRLDEDGNSTSVDIQPEQFIIDEYTNYRDPQKVGEPADVLYKSHLKDVRKAHVYFIGATHSDTNAAYPPKTFDQRNESTMMVRRYSADGKTPLPRARIVRGLVDEKGNSLDEFEGTFPDWFNPKLIAAYFEGIEDIDFGVNVDPEIGF